MRGLAEAIDLAVDWVETPSVVRPTPGTYFGSGQVERFSEVVSDAKTDLVLVDAALSPVQQRNLERALQCKVIDRTGLILEIFGARAQTREGQLQVERAALAYQRSRLVRSWTHLERQRGGFGFLGGPGESQLEIDRRLIAERIERIDRDLGKVKKTRSVQRKGRNLPVVALVGYTNAGKSTLFNRLTEARVMAKDQLFATLDPTMRRVAIGEGETVILSDTVGFISNLPTTLVAAFRATLEEVLEADLVLHVRDITHPDSEAQRADVLSVLEDLGFVENESQPILEVHNKIDLLPAAEAALAKERAENAGAVALSAATGQGLDSLLSAIASRLRQGEAEMMLDLLPEEGAMLAWLYRHARILENRQLPCGKARLTLAMPESDAGRLAQELAKRR